MSQEKKVSLPIDLKVYNLEALKKTSYRFADRASIAIKNDTESSASIEFNFSSGTNDEMIQKVVSEFRSELLDQDLRQIISEETKGIRNLILAHAFSKSSLIPQE
jgi:His-Xaa-Ser system protein HxsD